MGLTILGYIRETSIILAPKLVDGGNYISRPSLRSYLIHWSNANGNISELLSDRDAGREASGLDP